MAPGISKPDVNGSVDKGSLLLEGEVFIHVLSLRSRKMGVSEQV